jgi:hypothetical protein
VGAPLLAALPRPHHDRRPRHVLPACVRALFFCSSFAHADMCPCVSAEWSGINALLYYGPTLMRSLGMSGRDSNLLVAGGVNVVQFVAVLPAIFLIDKWGALPLSTCRFWTHTNPDATHRAQAAAARGQRGHGRRAPRRRNARIQVPGQLGREPARGVGRRRVRASFPARLQSSASDRTHNINRCVYVFTAAYGASIGPVAWVLPSEVFPLSMRGKGVAVSTASNWLNNCACTRSTVAARPGHRIADRRPLPVLIGLITPPLMEASPACVSSFASFKSFASFASFLPSQRVAR